MAFEPNNPNGRAAAADSQPQVLSTEDKAVLDNIKLGTDGTVQQLTAANLLLGATNEAAAATDTATSGHNGLLKRLLQKISALIALLPTSIGNKATAASLGVALSTEQASNLLDIRNDIFSMSSSLAKNSDLIDLKNITDVKLGDIYLATTNIEGYQSGFDTKLANIDSNTANIYLRQGDGNQVTQILNNKLADFRNSSLSLNVTSINSLASSLTACAVTERVTNIRNAIDLLIHVIIDHANTAPSTSGTDFVWLIPWYHDGSTWTHPDLGNTTVLTGSNQTVTLGAKHNLTLLGVMNYTLADQVTRRIFSVAKVFGQTMPDGFQILMQNDSGATYAASGNSMLYKEVFQKLIV